MYVCTYVSAIGNRHGGDCQDKVYTNERSSMYVRTYVRTYIRVCHSVVCPPFLFPGILMLWSWVLLAASAIFYARYTRPAYVNGEWFEVSGHFVLSRKEHHCCVC